MFNKIDVKLWYSLLPCVAGYEHFNDVTNVHVLDNAIPVFLKVVHSCSSQGYKIIRNKKMKQSIKFLPMCMVLIVIIIIIIIIKTLFNERTHLTRSIFHEALKYNIFTRHIQM